MVNSFASASAPPEETTPFIRTVRQVAEDHIRETWERHQGKISQLAIAFHLGISPTTLSRMRKRWNSEEDPIKDRR